MLAQCYQASRTVLSDRNIYMAASFLPSILVPLVGIVFPAAAMAFLFLYIERDELPDV